MSLVDVTFWIPQLIAFATVALAYIDMRRRQKNRIESWQKPKLSLLIRLERSLSYLGNN